MTQKILSAMSTAHEVRKSNKKVQAKTKSLDKVKNAKGVPLGPKGGPLGT